MGFSELERIQIAAKVLAASVKDADGTSQWYESTQFNTFVIPGEQVWVQDALLKANPAPGPGPGAAQILAATTLSGIIEDRSTAPDAVRLTPVPGVNNTYVALDTYNDFTSQRLSNWVQPQFVPLANNSPSTAYTVRLFNGIPAGLNEVLTTDGTTGTGIDKTVGWFMDYANGLLLVSEDFDTVFLSQTGNPWLDDPYIQGFRYTGQTASSIAAASTNRWIDQSLIGAQNSINTVFTTAVPFVRDATTREVFYVNGIRQREGAGHDYVATESVPGAGYDTITMGYPPVAKDNLSIDFTPF